ncbi:CpsD/CapB family tyrosine-protein kinase [Candidatus Sumerlaeota bacterium]|nr:CpsD/CapB family tyrosine-protein kinase [Candidatus Sumerlaeota bacterium]
MRATSPDQMLARNRAEMKYLEGSLVNLTEGGKCKSMLVTSCRRGEGKTTAAAMVSIVLARSLDKKVLLVDADMSAPSAHRLFSCESQPGLTDFLNAGVQLDECVRETSYVGLFLMPHGKNSEKAPDLFARKSFGQLVALLRDRYDYVVLDGEPVLTSPNASLLVRHVDGVILVAECESTKWEQVEAACEKIQASQGNALGVILNKRRYYVPGMFYGRI